MDIPSRPKADGDEESTGQPSRRAVVAGIAAALAATAAKLAPEEARAADGDPLIIGTDNTASSPTSLANLSPDGDPVLLLASPLGSGTPLVAAFGPVASFAATTIAPVDTALLALADQGAGIRGASGVASFALATTATSQMGLFGISDQGAGVIGVSGLSAFAPGVTATGIVGVSDTGRGVLGIQASAASAGLTTVTNRFTSGVAGVSAGAIGVLGMALPASGPGTLPLVDPTAGAGLRGIATDPAGIGVLAENPGGVALRVVGRLQMQTAGSDILPAGQSEPLVVSNPDVTADSHVTITFTVEPKPKGLRVLYVERLPGLGFAVHLKGRPRIAVPFTWSVVEPTV